MVITFCGHSSFIRTPEYEKRLLNFLEEKIGDSHAELFLGGYGAFDSFALSVGKEFKKPHPNTSLVFVTPYITIEYQKNHLEYLKTMYDDIIYPELEKVPLKFAISHRNKWMVEKADIVVAYVLRASSGAYRTYKYARTKRKEIFNLADQDV